MSGSCVGTCSNCGVRRFWLSDTMSLQLDDGRLKCLPHPGESYECEQEGLTLEQASDRGRLFRETFYVCRNCGKGGETIEKQIYKGWNLFTWDVRASMKWGWGSAVIVVPLLLWLRWWEAAVIFGFTLIALPGIAWRENRKIAKKLAARGLPRADAPGQFGIPFPTSGCSPENVIGQRLPSEKGEFRATGPCCDRPDWIEAYRVKDEDRVPCCNCKIGLMTVSEHAIH